jgi:voltage-gated potassium channel
VENAFLVPTLIASALVVPVVVIYDSQLGPEWKTAGVVLNWVSWLVFLAYSAAMLAVVPSRRRWIADHPLDILITILTPPFLTVLAPIRLLRLVALVRLAPVLRRLFTARGLNYTAAAAGIVVLASGAAFSALEPGRTVAEGVYLSIVTMTTLGSEVPVGVPAKILSVVVVIVGTGFVAILTGAIAQRFLEPEIEEEAAEQEDVMLTELRALGERLERIERALRSR